MLELQDLTGGYGKITILNGVSFEIPPATITTVIGPNGAGKSTVFKAVFGLLNIQSGSVLLDGQDVTGSTPKQMLDRGVTYVPQGRNVVPQLSVYHNLELGGVTQPDQARIRDRIEQVEEVSRPMQLDYLASMDLVLCAQDSDVFRIVVGFDMVTLQWQSHGQQQFNYKIMAMLVPQPRADYEDQTGLLHGTV